MNRVLDWIIETIYRDQARPMELLSFIAMAGFAYEFWANPTLLARDSYAVFHTLPPNAWVAIIALVFLLQGSAILGLRKVDDWLRIVANAASCAMWFVIASSFKLSGISTTAFNTYSAIFLMTAAMGLFLIWKKNSAVVEAEPDIDPPAGEDRGQVDA